MSIISTINPSIPSNQTHNAALGVGAGQRDLNLTLFSGEVLTQFLTKTVMRPNMRTRTISGSTSYQFPAIGGVGSAYHQPGDEIKGQAVNHGATTITVDDLLVSAVSVSKYEEMINHFEVRSEYTRQMGDEMAQAYDRKAFALALKAIEDGATGPIPELDDPAVKLQIGTTPTDADFIDAVFQMQQTFDERNIPDSDRILVTTPKRYYSLIQSGEILNQDYGNAGNGSQASGKVLKVAGLNITVSNNLAINNVNNVKRAGSVLTDYNVDGTAYEGLIMHKQALAAVHLQEIATESTGWRPQYQDTLLISKQANGMGVLRPDCLGGIVAEAAA